MKKTHDYKYWQKMTSEKLRKKAMQADTILTAGRIDSDDYGIIINLIEEELEERNFGKLFRAVCKFCKIPTGYTLTGYANHFALEVLKNDENYSFLSDSYEIDSYYTKTKCPLIVEF